MRLRVVASALVAAALVVALLVWMRAGAADETAATGEVFTVGERDFTSSVSALGAVKPQIGAEVRVGSRISGRVARLRANIGDRVDQGQIIAELETADLDAVIEQRRAELTLAEAKHAAVDRLAPEESAQAQAEVRRFDAEATLALEELQRQQRLLERQLVPRALADAARDRSEAAQAQLESARRTLDVVRGTHAEQRTQAAADVERARAALDSARIGRSFAVLRSPIRGVVASVSTQEGETVAAGLNAPTFLTVIDLDRLQLNAYVDEVDIGKIAPGQSVTFTVDAFPADDFTGRVGAIYPSATIQDNVVKYIVAATIDNDGIARLRPEMTAAVRIQLEKRVVLAVPARAIRREGGRNVVTVLVGDRRETRVVRVGWRDGAWIEIVDGLTAGTRVLVNGKSGPEAAS
jgi:macrolide-specific efflux system membrane fusion protein